MAESKSVADIREERATANAAKATEKAAKTAESCDLALGLIDDPDELAEGEEEVEK